MGLRLGLGSGLELGSGFGLGLDKSAGCMGLKGGVGVKPDLDSSPRSLVCCSRQERKVPTVPPHLHTALT